MRSATLYTVLGGLLVLIAAALALSHFGPVTSLTPTDGPRIVAGVVAGFGMGVVAAIMGVAGGELLIPAIALLRRRHAALVAMAASSIIGAVVGGRLLVWRDDLPDRHQVR